MPSPTPSTQAVEKIAAELGLTTELAQAVLPVVLSNLLLLDEKQRNYGPHNLTKFGTFGVVVRLNDKMERVVTLSKRLQSGDLDPTRLAEPLSDSFLDLANYALIAYVLETKRWPKV